MTLRLSAVPSRSAAALDTAQDKRPPQPNDEILLVGMNPTGHATELQALRRLGVPVVVVGDAGDGAQDSIEVGGRRLDLRTNAGLGAFRTSLMQHQRLPADQAGRVADAVARTPDGAKDEMARIAQVWAGAERGGSLPSRLLLSGHHGDRGVYGDGNGTLQWDALERLAAALPAAAARVEDVHLSACYSAGDEQRQRLQRMFPNLATVWGYRQQAPSAAGGAPAHHRVWEKATRGTGGDLAGTGAALGAASAVEAYRIKDASATRGRPLAEVLRSVERGQGVFDAHHSGRSVAGNPHAGPLRAHYDQVQAALQHPDLGAAERTALQQRRDATIRLLYYPNAAQRFAEANAARIERGFTAVGLPPPDFGRLNRREALDAIERFEAAAATNRPSAARDLWPALQGLRDLAPEHLPNGWL